MGEMKRGEGRIRRQGWQIGVITTISHQCQGAAARNLKCTDDGQMAVICLYTLLILLSTKRSQTLYQQSP